MTDTTAKILNLGISHGTLHNIFWHDILFSRLFLYDANYLIRMILNATSTYLILALAILGSAQGKQTAQKHFFSQITLSVMLRTSCHIEISNLLKLNFKRVNINF